MRRLLVAMALIGAATPGAVAQGGKGGSHSGKYSNKELGIRFSGVYGWPSTFAEDVGVWTELARYGDEAYDALVLLQVRDNPYKSLGDLRAGLEEEFQEGGEVAPGRPVYKDLSLRDVDMKKGRKLPGYEVEANVVKISEEGKKREYFVQVRTYFGRDRLYRVACSVKRIRARRVKDRFEIAIASLVVEGDEKAAVIRGTSFKSGRGFYRCTVPEGYSLTLPPEDSNSDMRFDSRDRKIAITVFSYDYDGDILDQLDDMIDYYGNDIEFLEEEIRILGGDGFTARVKRSGRISLVLGVVRDERVYRVHTTAAEADLERMRKVHEKFLESFTIER